MLITRGLTELACLLPQQLSFGTATRMLGWQTQESAILATTTLRNLVLKHGQIIREAEIKEAQHLLHNLSQSEKECIKPNLVPLTQLPRRRPGWPAELSQSVEEALQTPDFTPPKGVGYADWERVLAARRQERVISISELRLLGPEVKADQVLVTIDEVLTRTPKSRTFNEIRTARIVTSEGSRYLSGRGVNFMLVLTAFVLMAAGRNKSVFLLADGARWIRNWFVEVSSNLTSCEMTLDWFHLCKKCRELCCMICKGVKAKKLLLAPLAKFLWNGQVDDALNLLEEYRKEAKNLEKLDELIGYLSARRPYLKNYRERRRDRTYIGSGHIEKANDLIVAQRQKGSGMHWSEEMSDALAALKTLQLNGGWDAYWKQKSVMPLST